MSNGRDKSQITQQFSHGYCGRRIYLCDICLRTFECGNRLRRHKTLHSSRSVETPQESKVKTVMHTAPDILLKLVKLDSFRLLRGMLQNGLKSKLDRHFNGQSPGDHRNPLDRYMDASKMVSLRLERELQLTMQASSGNKTNKACKFCCAECGKRYRTKPGLRIHLNGHFGIKAFKCPKCGLRLSQKGGLKAHMRIHTGEKPYTCEVCNMKFTQQVSREHMSKHTGERLHKCDICSAEFGSQTVLKTHKIAKHTLLRPFQCDICKKTFTDKHYMTKHKTIHRPVKPYPCTKCEKSFITKSNLRRHLEIHTIRSSHACTVCSKSYNNSSSLLYHMTTHSDERKFICGICSQQLASKQNLEKHMTLHARREQELEINQKTRYSSYRVTGKTHANIHVRREQGKKALRKIQF